MSTSTEILLRLAIFEGIAFCLLAVVFAGRRFLAQPLERVRALQWSLGILAALLLATFVPFGPKYRIPLPLITLPSMTASNIAPVNVPAQSNVVQNFVPDVVPVAMAPDFSEAEIVSVEIIGPNVPASVSQTPVDVSPVLPSRETLPHDSTAPPRDARRPDDARHVAETRLRVVPALDSPVENENAAERQVATQTGVVMTPARVSGLVLAVFFVPPLILLLREIRGQLRLRQLNRRSSPAPDEIADAFRELCGGSQNRVRLRVCNGLDVPVVFGWFRVTLLLPTSMGGSVTPELIACLSHEWSHWKRGDLLTWNVMRLFQFPLWPQVFYWLLRPRLLADQDYLADHDGAMRLADRAEYAEVLLNLARNRSRNVPGNVLGMAGRKSELKRRIEMLLDTTRPIAVKCRKRRLLPAIVLMTLLMIVGGSMRFGDAKNTPVETPDDRQTIANAATEPVEETIDDAKAEAVAEAFLKHLKDERFGEAAELFSDKLRSECPEPFLRECIDIIKRAWGYTADTNWSDSDRKDVGALQSFDPPVKVTYPGGAIWESILRFENAVMKIRLVIGADEKIKAFEILSADRSSYWGGTECCYQGREIGRRLEFDHTIRVTFADANGEIPLIHNMDRRAVVAVYRKVNQLPPAESFPFSNMGPQYWTDPKDGSHWVMFRPEEKHSEQPAYGSYGYHVETGVYRCDTFPAGTYRLVFCNKTYQSPFDDGRIAMTDPVTVDAANREVDMSQTLMRGGTLRIRAVDAESGEPIENVLFDELRSKQAPSEINGSWTQYNVRSEVGQLYPGTYSFSVRHSVRTPDDRVCEPDRERYTVEIADGKETVVDVKLRTRPQTLAELNEIWPYVIKGTVRDLQGNPLSDAKVTLMGFLGHRPGSKSVTSDENGRYEIRFSKNEITAMWLFHELEPTPEKPDVLEMAISVERPGFVWQGVRDSEGRIVSDQFLKKNDNGIYSRVDSHRMHCFEPEPATPRDPETDVYPEKPKTLDIVMQPAVHIRGRILFDEEPEKPAEDDRWHNPQVQVIFDLPRAEGASWQPVFYGPIDERQNFDVSALPHDIDAFVGVSCKLPASWKDDKIIAETDFFELPPVGEYDMTLRWKTAEGNGITMRRLEIASMTDADGNAFEPVMTKPSVAVDYLFNHWTLTGTVRDDLGQPVEGAEVHLFRTYGWRFYDNETATTDSQGKYAIKHIATQRGSDHPKAGDMPVQGDLVMLQVRKEGMLQKNIERDVLVFLADETQPAASEFFFGEKSTARHCDPLQSTTVDLALNRNPDVEFELLDRNGRPMPGYGFSLSSDVAINENNDFNKKIKSDLRYLYTAGENGRRRIENVPAEIPFWFHLRDNNAGEHDILRTDNITFSPGATYRITLRYLVDEEGAKRIVLESVADADGNDVTADTVVSDPRTQPYLGQEETERGRKILQDVVSRIQSVATIDTKEIDSLQYAFHLGDKTSEFETESYRGHRGAEQLGITWRGVLHDLFNQYGNVRFRAIETDENEIRLLTSLSGTTVFGNGVSGTWSGYVQRGFDEALIVLDAETRLPKRVKTNGAEEEFYDWVPFGDPENRQFVPLRIACTTEGMRFDFCFAVHENDVWLFDRSVVSEGGGEKTICRIDDVRINRATFADEADEAKVREALRRYYVANGYWLRLYPEDLPEFGYTFHQRDREPETLTWDDIRGKDNWYAEFYRKGISYIGISRLLVIDIDALRCKRVVEDAENGTLEFDFVLKHDWMNAVGNGVSGTWLGWFNGGIGKGTAVLDTKTMTLREIRTASYDERYSDYVELKPGQFVPRRIVIDYHEGRSENDDDDRMLFDFRFKVYQPCLWLFDRSVEVDGDGNETEPPVWIDNVTVEGEPAVEIP